MALIYPKDVSVAEFHGYLLSTVVPRPIAFVSTIDNKGNVNLSPFSFFNAFSSNPPILIFSPNRRVRDNTTKHTYENVKEHDECVISIVNYDIVQQMSLSSTEYEKGVNEFIKSGFTEVKSTIVKPPRIKEVKVSFECKVNQIIELGRGGGAGNLVVCEVLLAHISDEILNSEGKIDSKKLDAVGRMGGDCYIRANGISLFDVPKPIHSKGIGYDQIPEKILTSSILTGNDFGILGNVSQLPDTDELIEFSREPEVSAILEYFEDRPEEKVLELHKIAKKYLQNNDVTSAWKVLLQ